MELLNVSSSIDLFSDLIVSSQTPFWSNLIFGISSFKCSFIWSIYFFQLYFSSLFFGLPKCETINIYFGFFDRIYLIVFNVESIL